MNLTRNMQSYKQHDLTDYELTVGDFLSGITSSIEMDWQISRLPQIPPDFKQILFPYIIL